MSAVDIASDRSRRSRAISALAALWLLLTLGIVLPSATFADDPHGSAGARSVAADQLRAVAAADRTDAAVEAGDRLDDGPDGPAPTLAGLSAGFPRQPEAHSPPPPPNSGRGGASPFEARAPPLG